MTDDSNEIKPRNALLIALQILQLIPEDKPEFYKDLDYLIKTDYVYKDHDALTTSYNWEKLQFVMHRHIPIVDEKWKEVIVDVFIGGNPVIVSDETNETNEIN
jgi:hypothetical protein